MINRKMIITILTLGILACVASAGTWAYFESSITTTNNKITAGTLDISGIANNDAGNFAFANAIPGTSGTAFTQTIGNSGNVPGDLWITVTGNGNTAGALNLQSDVDLTLVGGAANGVITLGTPYNLGEVSAGGMPIAINYNYKFSDPSKQNTEKGQTAYYSVKYELIQHGVTPA